MTPADLTIDHIRLARVMVRSARISDRNFDDCLADAHLALVRASLRFDPSQGVQFHSYAFHSMEGAIKTRLTLETRFEGRPPPDSPRSVDPSSDSDARLCVEQILSKLSPQDRFLLEERYLNDKKLSDIGPKAQTLKLIRRALKRAREVSR